MSKTTLPYKRILLKMSGGALMSDAHRPLDPSVVRRIVAEVKQVQQLGIEIGVVIGGGAVLTKLGFIKIKSFPDILNKLEKSAAPKSFFTLLSQSEKTTSYTFDLFIKITPYQLLKLCSMNIV